MSMDREDFESDEAWKNYLDQQMTQKFSAADFANARFAEHPDGRIAARLETEEARPWESVRYFDTDEGMAGDGWVPVPKKPTLTESSIKKMVGDYAVDEFAAGFAGGFRYAGGEIIPDPEPTDEELLAGIIRGIDDWQSITSPELLAKYLNTAGVTPPKKDN